MKKKQEAIVLVGFGLNDTANYVCLITTTEVWSAMATVTIVPPGHHIITYVCGRRPPHLVVDRAHNT